SLPEEITVTPVIKKESEKTLNLSSFQNIAGIKKPLVITSNATEHPGNTNMKDLFGSMDWTIISKRK
ncbi:MAG: hypothetical protein WCJ62_12970, partial [Flavobacterium sp.]